MTGAGRDSTLSYIYDGSFYGLMSTVHELIERKSRWCEIIRGEPDEPLLFNDYIRVRTIPERAEELISIIKKEISLNAYKRILFCYLSELPDSERYILRYLSLALERGAVIDDLCTHEAVKPLLDISESVLREWHRMRGLLRFRQTESGLFYAPFSPDHNILPLISPYFAKRMSRENWIIHDAKRGIASSYSRGSWNIVDLEISGRPEYSEAEFFYQDLWKRYFRDMAIEGRMNRRLQRQFIPQRYWNHLVEPIA